jgi:hypothetical protein
MEPTNIKIKSSVYCKHLFGFIFSLYIILQKHGLSDLFETN